MPVLHSSRTAWNESSAGPTSELPPQAQDAVLDLLECAENLSAVMNRLKAHRGGAALPDPWGNWSRDALEFMLSAIEGAMDNAYENSVPLN